MKQMMGRSLIAAYLVFMIVVFVASCDPFNDDYRKAIDIDRVEVADSLNGGDSALVIYTLPIGCNRDPYAATWVHRDTILCVVTLEFYSGHGACAHGPVVDSQYVTIDPGLSGDYLIVYNDTTSAFVSVPVTVLYPD